jgi:LEA14-like dessication related protein
MRISLTVAFIGVLLGACASQAKFEQPDLSIINMEVMESSLFTQRLKFRLRVQNPNDRELPVKGVSARFEVAGEELATGVSAQSFVVPPFGEAEFDLMVDAHMARAIIGMVAKDKKDQPRESLDYRLSGKISLSSGWLRSIPFSESGSFELK